MQVWISCTWSKLSILQIFLLCIKILGGLNKNISVSHILEYELMEVCPAYEPITQFKSKMSLELNVHS